MRTARMATTICCWGWEILKCKFQKVSSVGYQMPLAGEQGQGLWVPCPGGVQGVGLEGYFHGGLELVSLYTEVQCIMCYGHMGTPPMDRHTDKHNWKHYLPVTSLAGGNKTFERSDTFARWIEQDIFPVSQRWKEIYIRMQVSMTANT